MSDALRRPMTTEAFLDWEERQEARWEFDGVRPVAMTGGSAEHEIVGATLRAVLRERLRGGPCRVWGPTMKVQVQGRIRYPDAFVACTPVPRGATVAPDHGRNSVSPVVVVFEVLSPGTSRADRIEKLREYQAMPSILRYVILEQDGPGASVFARQDGAWTARALTGGDVLAMPEIGVEVPLAEVYADLPASDPQP